MQEHVVAPLMHAHLAAIGMTPNDIRGKVMSGSLQRIRRGAYHDNSEQLSPVQKHVQLIHASLPGTDPTNVVSHASAAVLHGLPVPASHLDRVWMTRRSSGHGDGGRHLVVRASPLEEGEVTVINGVTVTSLARTAADLARTLPYDWGVILCDAALRSGLPPAQLPAAIERHPRLRGIVRARTVVDFADARSESPAESMSRATMARAGIADPELQFEIFDSNGEFVARTDFAWPALLLVGEVDGMTKYGDLLKPGQTAASAVMADKRREEQIRQQGFWVVRWDWSIASDHTQLGPLIRRAMACQSRRIAS